METIKGVMKKDAHIKHETGFIRGYSCSGRIFKIMICVSEWQNGIKISAKGFT